MATVAVSSENKAVETVSTLRVEAGRAAEAEDHLAAEVPLEIRLGDRPLTVLLRTPGDDEDLVRGFLYSEGVLARRSDLRSLGKPESAGGGVRGEVIRAEVDPARLPFAPDRTFFAAAGCGVCGKTTLSALVVRAPSVASSLRVEASWLGTLPGRLRAAQSAFERTGGLHAAALFEPGATTPWAVREDIGRHNAVDKLIGHAWAEARLPLADQILVVSGRLGYEIAQKAIVAAIPIVVAVGAASTLAVQLAGAYGLTLATFVREGRMNIFGDRDRLLLEVPPL